VDRLGELSRALGEGKVVAVATESSFGFLADIAQPRALDQLLSLKPRGADKGQPLIVPSVAAWRFLVGQVPPEAQLLTQRFWPGRLSIVLPVGSGIDERVTLDGTIAVRVPGPSPALDIVTAYGRALTATSANLPGRAPALDATELREQFGDAVRDGRLLVLEGRAPGGAPSTLVKLTAQGWQVLREGAILVSEIEETLALTGGGTIPQ